jgi:hypothetical protein
MSTYTAVIGDCASVGTSFIFGTPQANAGTNPPRRNPQLATARIRTIVAPHIVMDAVGGFLSADFTIPAEEAQRWRSVLRYGSVCWLFDGGSPIYHGWCEQPVWTQWGDCQMTITGAYGLLGRSRMREAWDLWDMTLLTKGTGANENKQGSVNVNSDGSITLAIPAGTIVASDRCSVDLLLFGENAFGNDDRAITAFEFDVTDAQGFTAARRLRVIGKGTAGAATGDQLFDSAGGSAGVQGAENLNGSNQGAAPWTNFNGYRCLRIQIVATAGATLANDWYVTLDRIRFSTRERVFQPFGSTMDSAAVARDIFSFKFGGGTGGASPNNSSQTDLPQEFWPSGSIARSGDGNSYKYLYGLDPRNGTGTAPNSGVGITGFTALEWQSPADILAALVAIDGCHAGFYLPYNGRGGYDAPGVMTSTFAARDVGSCWLSQAPQLYYQQFTDPVTSPDYTIHTRQGAVVEPAPDPQPIVALLYANYQTLHGRQLSFVKIDANTRNYLYAQGFLRADDYTIQPAVGDQNLASSLAQQQLTARRQPVASATITIENDGSTRTAILKAGATLPHLALVRPGSVHIVDMNSSSGLRAGYATHIEWWGQTLSSNEKIEISLAEPPGSVGRRRAHGIVPNRYLRTRHGILPR